MFPLSSSFAPTPTVLFDTEVEALYWLSRAIDAALVVSITFVLCIGFSFDSWKYRIPPVSRDEARTELRQTSAPEMWMQIEAMLARYLPTLSESLPPGRTWRDLAVRIHKNSTDLAFLLEMKNDLISNGRYGKSAQDALRIIRRWNSPFSDGSSQGNGDSSIQVSSVSPVLFVDDGEKALFMSLLLYFYMGSTLILSQSGVLELTPILADHSSCCLSSELEMRVPLDEEATSRAQVELSRSQVVARVLGMVILIVLFSNAGQMH